jgi:hypothetical protein
MFNINNNQLRGPINKGYLVLFMKFIPHVSPTQSPRAMILTILIQPYNKKLSGNYVTPTKVERHFTFGLFISYFLSGFFLRDGWTVHDETTQEPYDGNLNWCKGCLQF